MTLAHAPHSGCLFPADTSEPAYNFARGAVKIHRSLPCR